MPRSNSEVADPGNTPSKPSVARKWTVFSIMYQNVRGIKTKLKTWNTNLHLLHHDVVAATETFLDFSVTDAELNASSWSVVRRDRGSRGGGVLLAARPGITLMRRSEFETPAGEDLWASFALDGRVVNLCVVYISPSVTDRVYFEWFLKVESFLPHLNGSVFIVGDLNLNSASTNVCNYYDYFTSFCNLSDRNNIYNEHGGKLDVVLTLECVDAITVSNAENGGIVRVDPYHPPLDIEIHYSFTKRPTESLQPSNIDSTRDWNFKKDDYPFISCALCDTDWTPVLGSSDVKDATRNFYRIVYDIFDRLVPKKRRCKRSPKRYPVWFNSEIIKGVKEKRKLHRVWKKSECPLIYAQFSKMRALLKRGMNTAYKSYMLQLEENLKANPKAFWQHISNLRSSGGFEPCLSFKGNQYLGADIANVFAGYFSSVYVSDSPEPNIAYSFPDQGAYVQISAFTLKEVDQAIKKLKPTASLGPDGIPASLIKSCRKFLCKPIAFIINLIISTTVYPAEWKLSKVIPIPKSKDKSVVEEYRPIAIMSTLAKIFEMLISKSISSQVQSFLCNEQHGFRPQKSVNTNLLTLVNYISSSLDRGRQVDVLYFDYRKAFDRVDNAILLGKLEAIGFAPRLLQLLSNYLSGRRQYVRYGCYVSSPYFTHSGVNQGSILGPLLFLLMINDVVKVFKHAKCLLYADDLKVYMETVAESDCMLLQDDIDAFLEWSELNRMELNLSKCYVMSFSRNRQPIWHEYKLGEGGVIRTEKMCDLGVTFDPGLTFNGHIAELTKHSFSRLGFVLRNMRDIHNPCVMKILFTVLVRSKLESSACVWSPHEAKYRLMIEKVQKAFLRYLYRRVHGYYPFLYPTKFLLGMLGMCSLEVRRQKDQMIFAIKVLRGHTQCPELLEQLSRLFVPENYVRHRASRRRLLFARPPCRTVAHAVSPLCRMHTALNTLLGDQPHCDVFADPWHAILSACMSFCEKDCS